jgi:N-methylhydantoinase A/oxoprolinase/acetone carboxylase beta subunit
MSVHKRLTTPHNPSEAVIEGTRELLARDRVAIGDVSDVVHGTTLVTNAVIERRGAVTGVLATAGFSDILDMGFERRYDLFDLRVTYATPLVPRRLRLEVPERVRFDGSVELALDEAAVRGAAKRFQELDVAAVAVCFLHSYANPAHELRAARFCEAVQLFVSVRLMFQHGSSSVGPRLVDAFTDRCSTAISTGWREDLPTRASAAASTSCPRAEVRSPPTRRGASRCVRWSPAPPPAP